MKIPPSLTILMADDDIDDLELMEDMLKNHRTEVQFHKVMNGRDALTYLKGRTDDQLPCLFIIDYNMPELNGSQLLLELSKEARYHKISKIVLSTSNAPIHMKECKDNGATDYFVKPTNMKDLNRVVEELMRYCNS